MIAGAINEFGKNPYDLNMKYFILTILSQISFIVGREAIRYFLLNRPFIKYKKTVYLFALVLMVLTDIPISDVKNIKNFQQIVVFISEKLGPGISENILLNYFSSAGSFISSVIYLSITDLFLFISPILPNLQWLTKGLVGISVPLFSYMFILNTYSKLKKEYKLYREKPENVFSWLVTCAVSISIIWFASGVFPIFPSAIVTGSMEPMIKPGDVVLINKLTKNEELNLLKIGDVIQFKRDEILIVHRIVDIVEEDGIICYKTKGDNNSKADRELVKAENIKGTLYKVIPKLGYPTLIFKNNNTINLNEVEFYLKNLLLKYISFYSFI